MDIIYQQKAYEFFKVPYLKAASMQNKAADSRLLYNCRVNGKQKYLTTRNATIKIY